MAMDLSHHMDMPWFEQAYRRCRKKGAVGVDGQTAAEYEQNLQGNLQELINRAKSGTYRAPPVRRVYIPKEGKRNEKRPLGIPTIEDKVLQRAVVMALEPVFEQDFLDVSYGFRPGRSQHQGIKALREGLMRMGGGYVIDLDIRRYFDSVNHRQIQEIFRRRVRDGVLCRLIGKWLNAGIMEEERVWYPEDGVPQGGVISPLLSNIFLHEVLDTWFENQVKPRLRGKAFMVRFADDAVLVFEQERDAQRVMDVLPKRLAKYGLQVHEDKTNLVRFVRPAIGKQRWDARGERDRHNGTFNFLGFTFQWQKTRRGGWSVFCITAKDRRSRSLRKITLWLRNNRHRRITEQHQRLVQVIRGHIQYFGISGNIRAISNYVHEIERRWRKWLARRSRKAKHRWEWFNQLLKRFPLPRPHVSKALDARHGS